MASDPTTGMPPDAAGKAQVLQWRASRAVDDPGLAMRPTIFKSARQPEPLRYFGPKFVNGELDRYFPPARFQLRRRDDWAARLHDVLERGQAAPYRYGAFDCVFVCRDAIAATTGHSLKVCEYDNFEGSQRFKAAAGGTLVDVWGNLLGPPHEGATGAVDGDIGLVCVMQGTALTSVFRFANRFWGPSIIGFREHPRDSLVMYWPIGQDAERLEAARRQPPSFHLRPNDPALVAAHFQTIVGVQHQWLEAQRTAADRQRRVVIGAPRLRLFG